ncbi:MAG: glycosyltransferase [Alphaproteobacteria bacterium]|nr:glycosyltransferase [Alphaproteobacteria bacterium]
MVTSTTLTREMTTSQGEPANDRPAAEEKAQGSVSVVVVVLVDEPDVIASYRAYREALDRNGRSVEFIYVLDQSKPSALADLKALSADSDEPLKVIALSRWDDEIGALKSAVRRASGDIILTLPAVLQVEPDDLNKVIDATDKADMVVAERPAVGRSWLYRLQDRLFHGALRVLFGQPLNDLVCRVRAYKRATVEEILGFSSQQHFLPILAHDRGFKIEAVDVAMRQHATPYARFGSQLRLLSDTIALFFVLKFVRKPLRFFGAIGLPLLLIGLVFTGALAAGRLLFDMPLADRPILILGVLMIVLGIQIIALGLIGEIIIFASGKRTREYTVEKIL